VIVPAGPPDTYFGVAQNMMLGVAALAKAAPGSLALPVVAAHVLECLLKAYLSRSGSDEVVRHPTIRHDLEALWAMAEKDGLKIPQTPPTWVRTLGGVHKAPYFLRYSTGIHAIVTPGAQPMTSELAALVQTVAAQLR
jgi:hypothetical protein